jgi:hypothetical protein
VLRQRLTVPVVDQFIADLKDCVREEKAAPKKSKGEKEGNMVAVYGACLFLFFSLSRVRGRVFFSFLLELTIFYLFFFDAFGFLRSLYLPHPQNKQTNKYEPRLRSTHTHETRTSDPFFSFPVGPYSLAHAHDQRIPRKNTNPNFKYDEISNTLFMT